VSAAAPPPGVHPWVAEQDRRVRFGVGPQRADWPALRDWVGHLEALGFDSFWVQDHPSTSTDCWTTLAALAVATSTIRLGTSVSCVYYRSPWLLARQAADVDRLSGGRLVLGLGIGDRPEEFRQAGVEWPPTAARQRALDETVHIVRGLWRGEPFTYAGEHFRVEEARQVWGPVQQPYVPLLIAGGGERGTLRQVAAHADMCNFGGHEHTGTARTLDDVRRKLGALRRHCAAAGRPPEAILRSHIALPLILAPTPEALRAKLDALPAPTRESRNRGGLVAGTPGEAVAYYRELVAAGMRYFIAATGDRETVDLLAEHVMPALAPA
jgi:alkanesulfonate monooxygenase SsuD/methylene tetrahydromethanopterin reductase-like flavin-dependent oxidoreductase (luciferase family)